MMNAELTAENKPAYAPWNSALGIDDGSRSLTNMRDVFKSSSYFLA